jgi:hypothetical protein
MTTTPTSLHDLGAELDGTIHHPGDPDWDLARAAWNLAVDQRPEAVVTARSVDDVRATVRRAAAHGLRVAPQSTGHHASPMGPLDGTVLLRLSGMRGVTVDPERRVARVEAGALWADVTAAAADHGLAALAGSAADVGVAGYTLGGGLSWLARSQGLAANTVTALEVVTADGEHRRVDADHDPDLFWALRGGGGSFAVVTALEIRLLPLTTLEAGALFFPLERAGEVLRAWRGWVEGLPDEVTTVARVLRFPPLPDLPPFLSGRSLAVVELASTLDAAATADLLGPLRTLGPDVDTVRTTPVTELALLHMDPPGPVPGVGDGILLADVTPGTIDAFLAVAGPGVDTPLLSLELRLLGGALAPGRVPGGAVSALDAGYLCFGVAVLPDPALAPLVEGAVHEAMASMAPWRADRSFLNFAESPHEVDAFFDPETLTRLRRVKAAYDPRDLVRAHQPVRPAEPRPA